MYDVQNSFTYDESTGAVEQTITTTAASTAVIDFGTDGVFFEPAFLHLRVTEVFESATGGATLTAALQSDSLATFGSPTVIATPLAATDHASLVKSLHIVIPFPIQNTERFYRLYFTASAAMTTGKIKAYINGNPEL